MMERREFITLLGGVAASSISWSLAARAQAMPAIGFLNVASADGYAHYVAAFRAGLKESGYVENQNAAIEYRWAEGHYDRLPAMAADLVGRRVAVIVANTPSNLAAKAATSTIPIVFTTASDPVEIGLVTNLRQPGGNITGVSQLNVEIGPKRLELAHELMPTATAIAVLLNPRDPVRSGKLLKDVENAAIPLGLQLHVLRAGDDAEIEAAFAGFAQLKAGVLVIGADAFFNGKSQKLAQMSQLYAVPAIYQYEEFVEAGGLMSYGGSIKESYRWAGIYAGRILKGEKPSDLPVQQSTTVELMVNLKAAKMLDVVVPLSLLGRADRIIE
jgi:putative tryptophan/tyrosine transport system substrate-binding protein